MTKRRWFAVVALAALCIGLTACWPLGSGVPTITVKGGFGDVADLALNAPVDLANVQVGKVTAIDLGGAGSRSHAVLTMKIKRSARVPAAVVAEVRRTSPLGEKYISLVPLTRAEDAPLLTDGATLGHTKVVGDVQDLVSSGTRVLGALSASQIATLFDESATAFAGKGPALHQLIAQLDDVSKAYADRSGTFERVIDNLDQLAGDLAPGSAQISQLLDNVAAATTVLNQESGRTFDLVGSLNRLLAQGNSLLNDHLHQFITDVHAIADITGVLREHTTDIGGILQYLPAAAQTLKSISIGGLAHGVLDILVCGVPLLEVPGDLANGCVPGQGS